MFNEGTCRIYGHEVDAHFAMSLRLAGVGVESVKLPDGTWDHGSVVKSDATRRQEYELVADRVPVGVSA